LKPGDPRLSARDIELVWEKACPRESPPLGHGRHIKGGEIDLGSIASRRRNQTPLSATKIKSLGGAKKTVQEKVTRKTMPRGEDSTDLG